VTALTVAVAAGLITAVPAVAATAVTVSGTRILHPPPYPEQLLPGYFSGDAVTNVDYPAAVFGMDVSVGVAAAGIAQAIGNTPGPVVVGGFSQGAIAVTYAKRALMALPPDQRPAADSLSFVTIGDPTARGGILRFLPSIVPVIDLTPVTMPETPYDTVVVNGEYDGWGDFPDRPWNLISVANALLGVLYVHGHYEVIPGGLDLSMVPAANITTTTNALGGRTTTYLIPTAKLPLVQPLRDIGVPEEIVAAIEAPLRAIVDAGYSRADPRADVAATHRASAAPVRTARPRVAAPPAQRAVKASPRQRGAPAAS